MEKNEVIKDILLDEEIEVLNNNNFLENKNSSKESTNKKVIHKPQCPNCGGNLIFEGGCNTCKDCGWSKCD